MKIFVKYTRYFSIISK